MPGKALRAQHHCDACRRRPALPATGGVNAFAQFAALLPQEQLKAVGAFWSPSKRRYTPPAITTFHTSLPPWRRRPWTTPSASGPASMAARTRPSPWTERICAALEAHRRRAQDDGRGGWSMTPASSSGRSRSTPRATKSRPCANSPAVSISQAQSSPWIAMHAQHETARCLLGRRADYVVSAVKDNQETKDLKAIRLQRCGLARNPRQRAMAASSVDAAPSSTSPLPTATPTRPTPIPSGAGVSGMLAERGCPSGIGRLAASRRNRGTNRRRPTRRRRYA